MRPSGSLRYGALFFGAVLLLVGWLCFRVLAPFLPALGWAIVLAVGLWKPWSALAARMPRRTNLAAAIGAVLVAFVVLLPATFLGGVLVSQSSDAASLVVSTLRESDVRGIGDVARVPWVAAALVWTEAKTGLTSQDLSGRAVAVASSVSTFLAAVSGSLLKGLLEGALLFVMTIFFLFFLFRDGASLASRTKELIPLDEESRDRLARRYGSMLGAIFRGSLLCALVQGVSGGVGWGLAGLPSGVLAGTAMGVLSLLPVGGTAIVWLPGCGWLWLAGHHGPALFLALWGAIVTSFLADNVLKPFLIGGQAQLDTLVVFVGVFGGISAFGLLGAFIGPMALAGAASLLDVLREMSTRSVDEPAAPGNPPDPPPV